VASKTLALRNAVSSMITQVATATYNDVTVGPAAFRRSDGTGGGFTLVKSNSVAGAITGFVAQQVNSGNMVVNSDVITVLTAAAQSVGSTYNYDIAQAAGQAFGWVSGVANAAAVAGVGQAAEQIAVAIFAGYGVGPNNTLAKIRNAVDFGLNEAAGGGVLAVPGAGANGLRDAGAGDPFYTHRSASGKPVSNIFSL